MNDVLIRCGVGCGRALTFARMREGQRGPQRILCEACAGEKLIRECGSDLGCKSEEAEAIAARLITRLIPEQSAHA